MPRITQEMMKAGKEAALIVPWPGIEEQLRRVYAAMTEAEPENKFTMELAASEGIYQDAVSQILDLDHGVVDADIVAFYVWWNFTQHVLDDGRDVEELLDIVQELSDVVEGNTDRDVPFEVLS